MLIGDDINYSFGFNSLDTNPSPHQDFEETISSFTTEHLRWSPESSNLSATREKQRRNKDHTGC